MKRWTDLPWKSPPSGVSGLCALIIGGLEGWKSLCCQWILRTFIRRVVYELKRFVHLQKGRKGLLISAYLRCPSLKRKERNSPSDILMYCLMADNDMMWASSLEVKDVKWAATDSHWRRCLAGGCFLPHHFGLRLIRDSNGDWQWITITHTRHFEKYSLATINSSYEGRKCRGKLHRRKESWCCPWRWRWRWRSAHYATANEIDQQHCQLIKQRHS